MASPLSLVKERFESKEKLVAAVEKLATKELWLGRVNEVKGLKRASNKKLIRLHALLEDAKKRFGNRDKLVQTIAELAQRAKDKDWVQALSNRPLGQLLDMHRAYERAAKRRAAAGEPEKKPKKEKKPMVKKPSAKASAPVDAAKAEAKEPKKAEAKPEKEAKSKPSASKSAATKAPAEKKAASKKTKKDE